MSPHPEFVRPQQQFVHPHPQFVRPQPDFVLIFEESFIFVHISMALSASLMKRQEIEESYLPLKGQSV